VFFHVVVGIGNLLHEFKQRICFLLLPQHQKYGDVQFPQIYTLFLKEAVVVEDDAAMLIQFLPESFILVVVQI
jgi:hypothetical protein